MRIGPWLVFNMRDSIKHLERKNTLHCEAHNLITSHRSISGLLIDSEIHLLDPCTKIPNPLSSTVLLTGSGLTRVIYDPKNGFRSIRIAETERKLLSQSRREADAPASQHEGPHLRQPSGDLRLCHARPARRHEAGDVSKRATCRPCGDTRLTSRKWSEVRHDASAVLQNLDATRFRGFRCMAYGSTGHFTR